MAASRFVWITQAVPKGIRVGFDLTGDSSLTRQSGGGWQTVDRPRRQASTEWLDYGPFTLTLPLILDGTSGPVWNNIEPFIAVIEDWEKPAGLETPKLTLTGPVPHHDLTWVCKPTAWAEAIRDPATGNRVQQTLTMNLLEYVPPTVAITAASPAGAAQQRQTTTPASTSAARTYTVKRGDTLGAIAVRFFGNYRRYADIARLNGIRDPNLIRVGQVLRLPAS